MDLQNVGILPHHYTASQSSRPLHISNHVLPAVSVIYC
jgi:hypothetical protein